jgi:uncharacterized protein YjiK
MRISFLNYLICFLIVLSGFKPANTTNQKEKDYDLSYPDAKFVLPGILHEISGITAVTSTKIACIQDENGILFLYDTEKKEIIKQIPFHTNGDYEGVTVVGKRIFILNSGGNIFEIDDFESTGYKVTRYQTGIPAKDNEGLCYDENKNMLLIGCKGKIEGDDKDKDKHRREIYGFNLDSKTLIKNPIYKFDLKTIRKITGIDKIDLLTSDIAIHPITGKLYLLSSADNLMFVFEKNGNFEKIVKLNPKLFPQPEGITFLKNGDMFISNEGRDKNATILRFNYK